MSAKKLIKKARRTFRKQDDASDCGVAALASVIEFLGGWVKKEELRYNSGTTKGGTTMLGLREAGEKAALNVKAFTGTLSDLIALKGPIILHVERNGYKHYIVYYGHENGSAVIGDPAIGIQLIHLNELDTIWVSKALLTFSAGKKFVLRKEIWKSKFRWLLQIVRNDNRILIVTIILGLVVAILSFTTAVFTEKLVDVLLPSKDKSRIIFGLIAWIGLLLSRSLFSYFKGLMVLKQGFRLNLRLTDTFLNQLFQLPKSFFDSRKKGDLITRLSDMDSIQASVSRSVGDNLINILTLLVAIFLTSFYDLKIAFFLICVLPLFFLVTKAYHKNVYFLNKNVMYDYGITESHYIDALSGIEPIKQFQAEKSLNGILMNSFSSFQNSVVTLGKAVINFRMATEILGTLSVVYILIYCVTEVSSREMELGNMLALFGIASIALNSTNQLSIGFTNLQEARAALSRAYDVVSLPVETDNNEFLNEVDRIKLKNIFFRFPGRSSLISDLSLTFRKGEITGITGDNGVGKSTMFQLIQNNYQPFKGSIFFDDHNLSQLSLSSTRRLIGFVPQNIKLFNQSLSFNITLNEGLEKEVKLFLKRLNLVEFFEAFPDGIDTILGEGGVTTSAGQNQVIALCRALFRDPKILLLDEATSYMDERTKKFTLSLISRLKTEMIIVVISHDSKTLSYADKVYRF